MRGAAVKKEYISIKEFAARAGVSVQAVYKRLDTSFKKNVKVVRGRKMLDVQALQLYDAPPEPPDALPEPPAALPDPPPKPPAEPPAEEITVIPVEVPAGKPAEQADPTVAHALIGSLQSVLKTVYTQLAAKDEQISALLERLREAQDLNRNYQLLLESEQNRAVPAQLAAKDAQIAALSERLREAQEMQREVNANCGIGHLQRMPAAGPIRANPAPPAGIAPEEPPPAKRKWFGFFRR